jgi:site-specific DNA-methyltransferase (adenine-specific)
MDFFMISIAKNMDCMEYMKQIQDKWFDLAICDPPYGIGVDKMYLGDGAGRAKGNTARRMRKLGVNNWDSEPPTQEYFDELFRVSKNQIIFGGNYFQLPPTKCVVVWDKMQYFLDFAQIEMIWTSFDKPAKIFRYSNAGFRCPDKTVRIHQTQKPVALYAYLLETFAKKGDRIFDSHLGSGSSRIAAYKFGFDFYATEINPQYYSLQEERFNQSCLGKITLKNGKTIMQSTLFK